MGAYIKNRILIINFSYLFPFGMDFEFLKIPIGFFKRPQYWWLFALQTDSKESYITICMLGFILDWRRKNE